MSVSQPLLVAAKKVIARIGDEDTVLAECGAVSSLLASNRFPIGNFDDSFRELMAGAELAFTRLGDWGALALHELPSDKGGRYLCGVWGATLCNLGLLRGGDLKDMKNESFSVVPAYVMVEMLSTTIYFGLPEEMASVSQWVKQLHLNEIVMASSPEEEDCWKICRFLADAATGTTPNLEYLPTAYRSAYGKALETQTIAPILELFDTREEWAIKGLRYDKPPFHAPSYALVPIEMLALLSLLDRHQKIDRTLLLDRFPGVSDPAASRVAALEDASALRGLIEIAERDGFFRPTAAA